MKLARNRRTVNWLFQENGDEEIKIWGFMWFRLVCNERECEENQNGTCN